MPTLIRLVVSLLFLAGLGYAGLYLLTVAVDPGQKEIVTRIPARDLAVNTNGAGGPPRPLTTALPEPNVTSSEPTTPPADAGSQLAAPDDDQPE